MKFSTFCSTISGDKKDASSGRVSARHRVQQNLALLSFAKYARKRNPVQGGGYLIRECSTSTGFACDPTGAARCRLGSTVAVLAPKRAQ
jgi:hypothetical protein